MMEYGRFNNYFVDTKIKIKKAMIVKNNSIIVFFIVYHLKFILDKVAKVSPN